MSKARAHPNIAFVKYWGKHPKWEEYHIPTKSSASFTVKDLYTLTEVEAVNGKGRVREFILNGEKVHRDSKDMKNVEKFINKLSTYVSEDVKKYDYIIKSENNFPTAAGLASSASGFAALTKALMEELSRDHSWAEEVLNDERKLSAVARLGSGSAARSITNGTVIWRRGWDKKEFDPLWDSYAERVFSGPDDIVIIYVFVSRKRKKVSSREGMKISVNTSPFYWYWVDREEKELNKTIDTIKHKKYEEFFKRVIEHSNSFHAVCRASYPPIEYLTDESRDVMDRIHTLNREYGYEVASYTFDAGPSPVLFTTKDMEKDVLSMLKGYETITTGVKI